ncbi:MAG: hypothetical protein KGQ67_03555 [Betaproteobacteria bacterium]|nr:hypothetical protein [Betaproteobacteria bacterium]
MRIEEARWIEQALHRHVLDGPPPGATALAVNLGSGPRRMREVNKPHVHRQTILPLLQAGWQVVHSDLEPADGVDIAGDLFDPALQARLRAMAPGLVMFCNVIEHLPSRLLPGLPAALDALLPPGGLLLVAAPHSYPYHADPIDNLHRPSPAQIAALFPRYQPVALEIVDSESYGAEFRRGGLSRQVRRVLRLLVPFVRPRRWLSHAHRMLWLARPYRHSLVLLRKPAA